MRLRRKADVKYVLDTVELDYTFTSKRNLFDLITFLSWTSIVPIHVRVLLSILAYLF